MTRHMEILLLKSLRLLLQTVPAVPAQIDEIDEQIREIDDYLHPPSLPPIMNERGGREA